MLFFYSLPYFYSNNSFNETPLCLATDKGSLNCFRPYSTALTTLIAFVEPVFLDKILKINCENYLKVVYNIFNDISAYSGYRRLTISVFI